MNQLNTKSSLTPGEARLVELLQMLNFGRIEILHVRGGQPVFDPPPRAVQKFKIGAENGPRPEASFADFRLKQQIVELLGLIAAMGDGQILEMEVKNGLPFSIEVEKRLGRGGCA